MESDEEKMRREGMGRIRGAREGKKWGEKD